MAMNYRLYAQVWERLDPEAANEGVSVPDVLDAIPDDWAKVDGEWVRLERVVDLNGNDWGEGQIGWPVYKVVG